MEEDNVICRKCLKEFSISQCDIYKGIWGCKECINDMKVEVKRNKNRKRRDLSKENKSFIDDFKGIGCCICGEKNIACLDLHHKEGDKFMSLSKMKHYNKIKIKEELEKCEVLCANCHRKLHMNKDIN